jgi:hypothetical protein
VLSHERVGVMVVRVWIEPELAPAVRARLTAVDDIAAGGDRVVELTAADTRAITDEIERWLDRWIGSPPA